MQSLERYHKAKYERFKSLLKWRDQLPELLEAVRSILPGAEVYVFGSALRNELTANSDVDILIELCGLILCCLGLFFDLCFFFDFAL